MLNIYAPINLLGYGIHANNMIKALTEKGEELSLTTIGEIQADPYFESYWKPATKTMFSSSSPTLYIFHDQFSNQCYGSSIYTFSIFETDLRPELNRNMLNYGPTNCVLVTTKRHKEILEQNGITKRIEIVHEGVDDCLFNNLPYDKLIDTKKFTYITVGKREKRKETDLIIKSFIEEFKGKEAALICHSFNPFNHSGKDHPFKDLTCWSGTNPQNYGLEYKGFKGFYHLFSDGKCDVLFTTPTIQTTNMPSLYHSANVGIQWSHGEAWDLPLIEMLACGLPVITTNCLGHSEYLEGVPEIQKDLVCNATGKEIANDGKWFKGDVGYWDTFRESDLTTKLQETFKNNSKYLSKDSDLSNYITENFSWRNAAETFLNILRG